jgi:transglutaminase-like putative cysteine protease
VRATARQIVGDETDPWRQAQALEAWVHQTLAKRMTIGLPSTLDVLAMRVGDCHEHTVLFTGLARSLGLSTRMLAGLVYQGGPGPPRAVAGAGRFYYHAWPEVWINGVWLPLDPTLGQPLADATHLGLLEAEGEELLALGRLVGRLSVQVVEADNEDRGA